MCGIVWLIVACHHRRLQAPRALMNNSSASLELMSMVPSRRQQSGWVVPSWAAAKECHEQPWVGIRNHRYLFLITFKKHIIIELSINSHEQDLISIVNHATFKSLAMMTNMNCQYPFWKQYILVDPVVFLDSNQLLMGNDQKTSVRPLFCTDFQDVCYDKLSRKCLTWE